MKLPLKVMKENNVQLLTSKEITVTNGGYALEKIGQFFEAVGSGAVTLYKHYTS